MQLTTIWALLTWYQIIIHQNEGNRKIYKTKLNTETYHNKKKSYKVNKSRVASQLLTLTCHFQSLHKAFSVNAKNLLNGIQNEKVSQKQYSVGNNVLAAQPCPMVVSILFFMSFSAVYANKKISVFTFSLGQWDQDEGVTSLHPYLIPLTNRWASFDR